MAIGNDNQKIPVRVHAILESLGIKDSAIRGLIRASLEQCPGVLSQRRLSDTSH